MVYGVCGLNAYMAGKIGIQVKEDISTKSFP